MLYEAFQDKAKLLPERVISLNCVTTVREVLNILLDIGSIESSSSCDSPYCPKPSRGSTVMAVSLVPSWSESWFVPGPSVCFERFLSTYSLDFALSLAARFPNLIVQDPAYDSGRPCCKGIRTHSLDTISPHLFLEVAATVSMVDSDDIESSKFSLDSIPDHFIVNNKHYHLRAVVGFNFSRKKLTESEKIDAMGHYVTFCKFRDNWICYDDVKNKTMLASPSYLVDAQLFLYTL